ncbi:putative methyltransferase-domain-containing protein [Leucosporidium creatinivorum]|uniref:Putative methyltransferase-domain-containing protein n=1 Tax=Leucosporidium creatinivorum TaxID=106004 RepID=A0A1Y2FLC6_9BASI|nr:putative methyltransferase-domain-containing protein [Leucosporidium creatinivorum]
MDPKMAMGDPNFPADLSIVASTRKVIKLAAVRRAEAEGAAPGEVQPAEEEDDEDDAAQDIGGYGIAGRTWEAAYLMKMYLTPPPPSPATSTLLFDPPCPLFAAALPLSSSAESTPSSSPTPKRTIIEIGSGTGFLSLALGPHLSSTDSLILTDLTEVCPLLSSNLSAAQGRWKAKGQPEKAELLVRPLPWGDDDALRRIVGSAEEGGEGRVADVVLASDLVYFPFLYPPLLRTLIGLTGRREGKEPTKVLFSYKIRSLVREQPFWSAFGRWFTFEAVLSASPPHPSPLTTFSAASSPTSAPSPLEWARFGTGDEDELFIFVCERRPSTYDWDVPEQDEQLMQGLPGQDGEDDQFEQLLLGGLEWD